jgi:uncharacterized protein
MELNVDLLQKVAQKNQLNIQHSLSALKLLVAEECTIPFVARYRKDMTGAMNEQQLRDLQEHYQEAVELEKRKLFVVDAIDKMEKLTPELKSKILKSETMTEVEDIYAPFKSKRKTKAQLARDYGLEPLAKGLKANHKTLAELEAMIGTDYVKLSEGKVDQFAKAVECAKDIIIEEMAHHVELKNQLRQLVWETARLKSTLKKDGEKNSEAQKFKDFFQFEATLGSLNQAKAGHRYLALSRGAKQDILSISLELDLPPVTALIWSVGLKESKRNGPLTSVLDECVNKSWKNYLLDSLDLEVHAELKRVADDSAKDVFASNLKQLLLAPYLGAKRVLGIDPGFRSGCKLALVDESGKFLLDGVIYPHAPQDRMAEAKETLKKLIEKMNVTYIAVGNGTAGQETLQMVQEVITKYFSGKVNAVLVSEAGASVYSASPLAATEFPNLDVTVRGAISIARRFQDPLSELVKIDPKSIGVGQYQHDVNQVKLAKSLEGVVEDCVNFVGVNLNTASFSILSYISGIGPSLAKNIVSYREKHSTFKRREELLKIPRFTDKVYQQAAGFLRVEESEHPLDKTFVHPEHYPALEKWCQSNQVPLVALAIDPKVKQKLSQDKNLEKEIGPQTFKDIVKALSAPKQDPRQEFKNVEFAKDIREITDLKIGQWYQGVVTNITMFGAFVNLGIKTNGLVHVSQISDEYITNPMDKLKVGQELKVKVLEVDKDRGRVSLSCKTGQR